MIYHDRSNPDPHCPVECDGEPSDASELQFVLGHEFGHASFGHLDIAVNHLMESGDLLPLSAMRLRAWQRAAEISADRAGLMLCGSLDAALRATFKASSGIFTEGACTSPEALAGQWQRLLCSSSKTVRGICAALTSVSSSANAGDAYFLERLPGRLDRGGSFRGDGGDREDARDDGSPAPIVRTVDDPMLASFFFGGLYVALADAELHPTELRRLESVIPPGVTLDDAHLEARKQPSACLDALHTGGAMRRKKLASAVELHRVIYGLIDIASADGAYRRRSLRGWRSWQRR